MANNIKGITIEIGGNTAPLDKALKDVNKTSRDLQSELREVNKQLKLDPTNTALLEQKQKLLAESVMNTRGKLQTLKEAEKQVQEQFQQGKVSEEQYRALQREVIKTEQQLKTLESQAGKSSVALSKISTTAGNVADTAGNVARKTAPATIAIAALGKSAFDMGSDFIESTNKVEVAFKDNAKSVEDWSKTTLDKFGIASGSALDMAALFGDMGTAMGQSTDAAANMSTSVVGLAGDLASFKNIGIDRASEALKGIYTGEGEALKSLGIIMQDSTLKEYAHSQGITKKYEEMTQAEKVQLRYSYVMEMTKNAQGDFARTSDGAANSMRVASESAKEAASSVGVMLAPIIAQAAQYVAGLAKDFAGLDDGTKKVILVILALIAAIAPVAGLISAIATIVGTTTVVISTISGAITLYTGAATTASAASTALAGAITFLTGPVGIAIAIIGALIAVGVLLYKNWDTVKAKAIEIKDNIAESFNNIKAGVGNAWENVKSGTSQAWQFIQGKVQEHGGGIRGVLGSYMEGYKAVWSAGFNFLDNITGGKLSEIRDKISNIGASAKQRLRDIFNFDIPHIKLPHFTIKGKFSLNPPQMPALDVDWYDKGGIFSSPQVIGVGEKRPEFVGALDDLRYLIRDELNKDNSNNNSYGSLLNTDKVIINNGMDIQALAQELEFYRQQFAKSKGGA